MPTCWHSSSLRTRLAPSQRSARTAAASQNPTSAPLSACGGTHWDNGSPARCGTRNGRPARSYTGTMGVSPVEMEDPSSSNGQDATPARASALRTYPPVYQEFLIGGYVAPVRRLVPPPTPYLARNVENVIMSTPAPGVPADSLSCPFLYRAPARSRKG